MFKTLFIKLQVKPATSLKKNVLKEFFERITNAKFSKDLFLSVLWTTAFELTGKSNASNKVRQNNTALYLHLNLHNYR